MWFRTNGLTSMITGSGQVNLLSGWIRRYQVGFGSATRCVPANPLGRGAGWLGRADRAHKVRPAGLHRGFGPNADVK
jgi:hypothetical protein